MLAHHARQALGPAVHAGLGAEGAVDVLGLALAGDVDDAAKTPRSHAIHRGLDELDGGEHVGVHRLDPGVAVQRDARGLGRLVFHTVGY